MLEYYYIPILPSGDSLSKYVETIFLLTLKLHWHIKSMLHQYRWASLLCITPQKGITICLFLSLPGLQKTGRGIFSQTNLAE